MDATDEPSEYSFENIGRLVNHGDKRSKTQNARVKVMTGKDGQPILTICSIRQIEEGEEILYDYGIDNLPWVSFAPVFSYVESV